ncbi:MAG: alpha/beta fold hydrolase [Acidimicrobiales bacterium]
MQTLVRNGIRLAWDDHGDGDPPLVLVHGWTGSSLDFGAHVELLAARRRVITLDLRGHGRSGHAPPDHYTFEHLVDDVVAVIDAAGGAPVHLLGHSMGGRVAMRLALEQPELVRSLILMDTAAASFGDIWSLVEPAQAMLRAEGLALLDRLSPPSPDDELAGPADRVRRDTNRAGLDIEAFIAFARELTHSPPVVDDLARIDVATTVIVGDGDHLYAASTAVAEAIAGARLHVVEGAFHSPQLSHPDEWRTVVEAHLEQAG